MENEIEAKFLDVDIDDLREKLKSLGAELMRPEGLMRRVIFDIAPHEYARVRNEGDKIVMTYKNVTDGDSILGTKEINLEVNDFEHAVAFVSACGLPKKAWQETKRELWKLGDVEICIDTWPWIPTFVEIEGPSEESVWSVAKRLGFNKADAHFGAVSAIYKHYYGIEEELLNLHTPKITFDMTPPDWVMKKTED